MPSFTKRDGPPVFSAGELAAIMGVTTSTVVRWITQQLLSAKQEGEARHRFWIAPDGLLEFIRRHGDVYDPNGITDEPLRAEAQRVDAANPLLSLEALAEQAKLPLKVVHRCALDGGFQIVRRPVAGKSGFGPLLVRRSELPAALKALKEVTANASALDALHALLATPTPTVPEEKTMVKTVGPGYQPNPRGLAESQSAPQTPPPRNGATDWRGQPLPAKAPQPRCERCGGRLLEGEDEETHRRHRACLACGHTQAAGSADPVAERQQQDLERARAEADTRRGPGRPPKTVQGGR